jgi:phage associated protein|nr:MAG TPA: hypothetical protein [Caudoviricetes sp.]
MNSKVNLQYIGLREFWKDNLYHTGLHFERGQIRLVSADAARKLLRHSDVFKLVTNETSELERIGKQDVDSTNETSELERAGKQDAENEMSAFDEVQDVIMEISQMDKESLSLYAQSNYSQSLDKRKSVDTLREEVVQMVHQFGIVK